MDVILTQDTVLKFLLDRGGKAKNSDMLSEFKGLLNCGDPEEKKQNRDLFKRFVNNVAVVKDCEGVKYIVIKKKLQHLVKEDATVPANSNAEKRSETISELASPTTGEDHSGQYESAVGKTLSSDLENNNVTMLSSTNEGFLKRNSSDSFLELALHRTRASSHTPAAVLDGSEAASMKTTQDKHSKAKKSTFSADVGCVIEKTGKTGLVFAIVAVPDRLAPNSQSQPDLPAHYQEEKQERSLVRDTLNLGNQKPVQKPYMLPLRVPPPQINTLSSGEENKEKLQQKSPLEHEHYRSPRTKRRQLEETAAPNSPYLKRVSKIIKPGEDQVSSDGIPLDPAEHEWLVKTAAGQWTQAYGLLLRDTSLAGKRDFMSGFTALHWAAKSGNSCMVGKIIEVSKRGGTEVDVNAKTYGGYTPLHIAAIHGHEQLLATLVQDYGANSHIRDNSGKKPYQYLQKKVSAEVKELLGDPHIMHQDNIQRRREDEDRFQEHLKTFKSQTLSRLFNPHLGTKKKHAKQRPGFYSISEEQDEERKGGMVKRRPVSELFL
ncbi:ankyrin repeat domain-containing protein SOWAHA [Lepisosteus oculatus]|uniref:ankyrin repeat domain-containing protein SOWAHA n=1 Tax=Lepisosteus oculatus TaxID=7918 RepID=UPI0035F4FEBE